MAMEYDRIKVILEDGEIFDFVRQKDGAVHYTKSKWGISYSDTAHANSIHAVIGEPLEFTFGVTHKEHFKSNIPVKEIKFQTLHSD